MATDDPHMIHLEGRVDRLETDVTEIKSGVKTLLDRPQNPGFTQVIGTLVSTLAACALVFGFAEWRLDRAVTPVQELARANEVTVGDISRRVWEDRIRTAVLEERTRWLERKLNVSSVLKMP